MEITDNVDRKIVDDIIKYIIFMEGNNLRDQNHSNSDMVRNIAEKIKNRVKQG